MWMSFREKCVKDLSVGKKVRAIREQNGISAKDLAAMAEITPSMLTQIEKGQANPSINTMRMIAEALNTPLYKFFIEENRSENLIVRKSERKKIGYELFPEIEYELLMPSGSAMEFSKMTLLKHRASSSSMFSHEGEELSLVTKGTATLVFENEEHTLEEGDSVRIPIHQKHRWENRTDEDVEVIFVVDQRP